MSRRSLAALLFICLNVGLVVPMAVRAAGPRVPLVLIHGLAGSPESTWGAAMKWFGQKGYVVGQNLFAIDLRVSKGEAREGGVLIDAAYAADEVRRILRETGATQVDLVGNSRGGLIVRLLAAGETAALVRRAVTVDAPHGGILEPEALYAMLDYAKVDSAYRSAFALPTDLQAGSAVLRTMMAREARFADRRAPALAIGSTWQDGFPPVLAGHDGFVPLSSQLAWPGAQTLTQKIGPTPAQLTADIGAGAGVLALVQNIPHVAAPESELTLDAIYAFITAENVAPPARACEPDCNDWTLLAAHWSEATVRPMLDHILPYTLDERGQRVFDPSRPMTRAEFVYGLVRAMGLTEQLGASAFSDLVGHWSLGYVEAAVAAKLVAGLSPDTFGPDRQLTRAQAATLIVRVKKLPIGATPSRFGDARGHWAEANIEAAAENGIIKGDERGFRPDDPVTMAEAAVILSRSFGR